MNIMNYILWIVNKKGQWYSTAKLYITCYITELVNA